MSQSIEQLKLETKMMKRIAMIAGIVVMTSGFIGGFSSSEPEVWDIWEDNNPANTQPIDHSAWDGLLKKYIKQDETGLNRFAYGKVSAKDNQALNAYIKTMSEIEISDRAKPVQFAYWVNMYNAITIKVILDNYPVKSIRDIDTSGIFANGPWGSELVTIEEETLTLDDIEHAILRPIWKDPRIHYAVNCASIGCPNLSKDAFTAANTEKLLEEGAKAYINNPRGFDIEDGELIVSSIYKWFAYDFGNSEQGVIDHLSKYASAERLEKLKSIKKISDTDYDWSLNE